MDLLNWVKIISKNPPKAGFLLPSIMELPILNKMSVFNLLFNIYKILYGITAINLKIY